MSFPRYERYKQSGVEWLGDVPEHWEIAKFRHVFTESTEKIENEVVGVMLSVSGYRGIEVKEYEDENQRRLEEDLVGYRIVRPGQLVVNTMWLNYAGLGISDLEGHVSPAYRAYWIDDGPSKRFLHHLMRSDTYVRGYTKFLTGVRPNSLQMSRDDLMVFPILLPPHGQQASIAAFLDRETAKIDALIEEQRRLIALLKEKRQAVISHAVTKGLDPTVSMKDCGIKWIGTIPLAWRLTRVKHVVEQVVDCLHSTPTYDGELLYPAIRTADLEVGFLLLDQARLVSEEVYRERTSRLEPMEGDVLYSREGERFGIAALVPAGTKLCLGQRMMMFRCRPEQDAEYFMWLLNSRAVYEQVLAGVSGPTAPHVNIGEIVNFQIAVPHLAEQREISRYLKREISVLDALNGLALESVAFLQERRSSLISAAVTGKINVTAQIPKPVRSTWSTGFARQVLAAETLSRCNGPRMGRIKLQKLIHLCEYHAQLDELGSTYSRKAAGPFDAQAMAGVRKGLLQQRWFEEFKDGGRYAYRPLEKVGGHKQYLTHWEDKQARIDQVLNLLGGARTRTCEIASTLYAAWNDLLIEGRNPTDAEIIHEASSAERWHESKEKIAPDKWPKALQWMRVKGLVPVGYGAHTTHKFDQVAERVHEPEPA